MVQEDLFENLEDDFNVDELDSAVEETKNDSTNTFDWNDLPDKPDGVTYVRENLGSKTVVIKKAEIITPDEDVDWTKGRTNKYVEYKNYLFRIEYETPNNDREFLSGMRGFKRKNGKIGMPNIQHNGDSQASRVYQAYAKYKGVAIDEMPEKIGLREFMAFLNSKPKVKITAEEVEHFETGEKFYKNMPLEFVRE